uniref:Uncharacterized protein n=1 Tax=Glossina palpalis gambiensis TaxID=67801 RepID=A0A1B0BIR2_9MUSC
MVGKEDKVVPMCPQSYSSADYAALMEVVKTGASQKEEAFWYYPQYIQNFWALRANEDPCPNGTLNCTLSCGRVIYAVVLVVVVVALRGAVLSLQNPSKHDRHANEFLRIMWYVRQRKKWRNLNVHICEEKT